MEYKDESISSNIYCLSSQKSKLGNIGTSYLLLKSYVITSIDLYIITINHFQLNAYLSQDPHHVNT